MYGSHENVSKCQENVTKCHEIENYEMCVSN